MSPGETTFAAALYPPGSDTPAETFSLAILVRAETGATASLTYDQCGDIVGIDNDGTVGMTIDSNATTGYSWQVTTPPDATLTADADSGKYAPPPADAPPGAGGAQHFGWIRHRRGLDRRGARLHAGGQPHGRPDLHVHRRSRCWLPPDRGDSRDRDHGHAAAHVHARHGGGTALAHGRPPAPAGGRGRGGPLGPGAPRLSGDDATADGSAAGFAP